MTNDVTPELFHAWGPNPLQVARDNKLLDLYLETHGDEGNLSAKRDVQRLQRDRIEQTVVALATALGGMAGDWAVFKTLRPFPFTPSDVDVVVFDEHGSHRLASRLNHSCYRPAGDAPHTLTVCDIRNDVGIDFYQDIAASWFVYLDRTTLRPYRTECAMGGITVPILAPVAELIAILAHAVYKEQTFTLNDYLTIRRHGELFGQAGWDQALNLAAINGVERATFWCLRLAKGIAQVIGEAPPWPPAVDRTIGQPIVPRTMPCRALSPRLLWSVVGERITVSERSRRSLVQMIAHALNPASRHTRAFYRQLWLRATGEVY